MVMNFIKKSWGKIALLTYVLLLPLMSLAQVTGDAPRDTQGRIVNPLNNADTIQEFVANFLTGIIRIGMPVVALAIVYCGFLFVSARGNMEKLTKAKDALLYTIIGAGILLGSWAIAQIISDTALAL